MGIGLLVLGHSGSGKSASMRNCTPDRFGVINVQGKPLPFKSELVTFNSDNYEDIIKVLKTSKAPSVVIDDSQYLMSHEFMYRANEKGYDKFSHIGTNFFRLLETIRTLPNDKIVYLMHHIETNDVDGREKAKTVGKMLDNQLTVEGCFNIVLLCSVEGTEHYFITQSDGYTTAKSPEGMLDLRIPNDLKAVDLAIRKYYGMEVKNAKNDKKRSD